MPIKKIYREDGIDFELIKKTKNKVEAKKLATKFKKEGYNGRVRHFYKNGKIIYYGALKSLMKIGQEKIKEDYETKLSKAMKLSIDILNQKIRISKKLMEEYDVEYKKTNNTNFLILKDLCGWDITIYNDAIRYKKDKLREKRSKLEDKLMKIFEGDNYGYDYPDFEVIVENILKKKGLGYEKLNSMMSEVIFYEDELNLHLSTINWRKDLLYHIDRGEFPELKGKRIPQLSFQHLSKKDFVNVANKIAKEFSKTYNVNLTKAEINSMRKELMKYT